MDDVECGVGGLQIWREKPSDFDDSCSEDWQREKVIGKTLYEGYWEEFGWDGALFCDTE